MNGKSKCKILKDIRQQIARDNDIEYVTSECKYQGECSGTCPKCEAELRYLEGELEKRRKMGKAVAVAGVAAAVMIGTSGCELPFLGPTGGAPLLPETQSQTMPLPGEVVLPGDVYVPESSVTEPLETRTLMGDLAYEEAD